MKNFDVWNKKKKELDMATHMPPFVRKGDIWWASLGENVGSEIGGKSELFSRPVIIFKKLSHSFYFVIPTTTKEKTGSWYASFRFGGKNVYACLNQVKVIDHRRLSTKMGEIDETDSEKVKDAFGRLYL